MRYWPKFRNLDLRCAIYAGLALCCVTKVHASPSVENLLKFCKSSAPMERALCENEIYGLGDLMSLNGLEREKLPVHEAEGRAWLADTGLCTNVDETQPSGAAMLQAFLNWADKHPEKWSLDAGLGIIEALRSTWPCKP